MKFAIGDDVGQLKVITAPRGTDTSLKASARPRISTYFTPDRKGPVYAVCKIDKYQGEERAGLVAVVFTCGKVKLVDTSVSPVNGEEKYLLYTHTSSTTLSTTATASPVVSAGVQHGILYLFRANGEVVFYRFDGEPPSVKTVPLAGNIAAGAIFTEELVNGWPSAIAIGGEKRDLEVFEPTTEGDWKSVWKAKNVKQDKLGLEVPVYIRRILFLGIGGGEAEGDTAAAHPGRRRTTIMQTCGRKYRLATGTQHSHLRIYDAAVSRRPIFTTTLTKSPILSLHLHPSTKSPTTSLTTPNTPPESSITSSPHNWIYTDSNGHFALYNSTTRREAGIYQGSTGAVNATATFSKDIVTGVGFDRYLRVYEGSGREVVVKAYVRSKGTAVVVLDGGDEAVEVEKSRKEEEEEEVWGEMDEVGGGSSEGGGEEGDFTDVLVKVRRRRPRTDKEGGGSKKRRLEV
ncbi:hypothetical protein HOY82DRAFT_668901 [Tuber indicum]|nr:hypothetical protein HOY82DRAFT_668901 [Tuber indicum]